MANFNFQTPDGEQVTFDAPTQEAAVMALKKYIANKGVVSDTPGGGWNQRKADEDTLREIDPMGSALASPEAQKIGLETVGGPSAAVLASLGVIGAPVGAASVAGGAAADWGMKKAGVPSWARHALSIAAGMGTGSLTKKAIGMLAEKLLERGGGAAASAALPAVESQLAGKMAAGVGEDTAGTMGKILEFGRSAEPAAAEAVTEAAPAAAQTSIQAMTAAAREAAKMGAKPGTKLWFIIKNGKPVGSPITPDQARAAERAGEQVDFIRNIFGGAQ